MKTKVVEAGAAEYAGQAGYTRISLRLYDMAVYGFAVPVLWRCTKEQLLAHYDEHVSGRHLDIGVATGALLDRCHFPVSAPEITLMDLNPNSLAAAASRLRRYSPRTHEASVLTPWEFPPGSFDSVAMTNLLHCVPGTIEEKAVSFDHARTALVPGGTLFGTTLLGKGVSHTRGSLAALRMANRRGTFGNIDDSLEGLEAALSERFPVYEVDVQGVMALFVAQAPR